MANPIKTSDIYQDTGDLKKLIAELEDVGKALTELKKKEIKASIKLQKETEKLSASTNNQRQKLSESAKQTAEIEKRYEKYNASLTENAQKIAALKNAQGDINRLNKLEAKLLASKEDSYNAISAQLSINKIRLKQLTQEERKSTKEGKALVKETNNLNDALKEMDKEIGVNVRNVGNYESALGQLPDVFRGAIQGVKNFGATLTVLAKNPIALILTAIVASLTAIFGAFQKSQEGGDIFNKTLEQVNAVIDVTLGRFATLGKAVTQIFQGEFSAAADTAKSAFTGVREEIEEAIEAAAQFRDLTIAIEEEQIQVTRQSSRLKREIKDLNKIAEDTTKGTKEREAAAAKAIQRSRELLNAEQSLLVLKLDQIDTEITNTPAILRSREQQLRLAEAEAAVNDKETEILELQTTLNNKLNIIRDEGARKAEAATKARIEAEKAAIEFQEKSIDRLNAKTEKTREAIKQANKEQSNDIAKAFRQGLAQSENEILEFVERLKGELQTATGDEALGILSKLLDTEKALQDAREFKVQLDEILTNEVSTLGAKRLEVIPIDQTENDQKRLNKIIDNSKKEIIKFKAEIKENGEDEGIKDIYDLLGLSFEDEQKQGIQSALQFAKDQLLQFAALRTQIAQQNVEAANTEVEANQRALQIEIANRNSGFANRAETAQKELDLAKENQKKALAEKEKAAKAEQRLQTIQQSVNLVSASAKIFQQVGNPLIAIPLIAVMFGAFAAAKVRASKLSKKQFAKGGLEMIGGGSHASGNDTYLGFNSDNKRAYAEKGEAHAIITKSKVPKYKSLLPEIVNSLNRGDFENRFERIGNTQLDFALSGQSGGQSANLDKTESELAAIRRQGEGAKFFRDGNGNLVRQYKNVTTVYV